MAAEMPGTVHAAKSKLSRLGYVLVNYIGHGSFGHTVAVRCKKDKKKLYALKIIRKSLKGRRAAESAVKEIDRESGFMKQLDSLFVCKSFGLIHDDETDFSFLKMEFVNGINLAEYLQDGPMPEVEATIVFWQLVQALLHCHQKGIAHRDIKPENIMLSANSLAMKLIDFGMSESGKNGCWKEPFPISRSGTKLYIEPEAYPALRPHQCPKMCIACPDCYAGGVSYFQMLVGSTGHPHQGLEQLGERNSDFTELVMKDVVFPATSRISPGAQKLIQGIVNSNAAERFDCWRILSDPHMQDAKFLKKLKTTLKLDPAKYPWPRQDTGSWSKKDKACWEVHALLRSKEEAAMEVSDMPPPRRIAAGRKSTDGALVAVKPDDGAAAKEANAEGGGDGAAAMEANAGGGEAKALNLPDGIQDVLVEAGLPVPHNLLGFREYRLRYNYANTFLSPRTDDPEELRGIIFRVTDMLNFKRAKPIPGRNFCVAASIESEIHEKQVLVEVEFRIGFITPYPEKAAVCLYTLTKQCGPDVARAKELLKEYLNPPALADSSSEDGESSDEEAAAASGDSGPSQPDAAEQCVAGASGLQRGFAETPRKQDRSRSGADHESPSSFVDDNLMQATDASYATSFESTPRSNQRKQSAARAQPLQVGDAGLIRRPPQAPKADDSAHAARSGTPALKPLVVELSDLSLDDDKSEQNIVAKSMDTSQPRPELAKQCAAGASGLQRGLADTPRKQDRTRRGAHHDLPSSFVDDNLMQATDASYATSFVSTPPSGQRKQPLARAQPSQSDDAGLIRRTPQAPRDDLAEASRFDGFSLDDDNSNENIVAESIESTPLTGQRNKSGARKQMFQPGDPFLSGAPQTPKVRRPGDSAEGTPTRSPRFGQRRGLSFGVDEQNQNIVGESLESTPPSGQRNKSGARTQMVQPGDASLSRPSEKQKDRPDSSEKARFGTDARSPRDSQRSGASLDDVQSKKNTKGDDRFTSGSGAKLSQKRPQQSAAAGEASPSDEHSSSRGVRRASVRIASGATAASPASAQASLPDRSPSPATKRELSRPARAALHLRDEKIGDESNWKTICLHCKVGDESVFKYTVDHKAALDHVMNVHGPCDSANIAPRSSQCMCPLKWSP